MSLHTYKARVVDVLGNNSREVTFSSIYANPAMAVTAFEELNHNKLRVVELRATLSLADEPLAVTPNVPPAATPEEPPRAPEESTGSNGLYTVLLDDTVAIVTNTEAKTLRVYAEYDSGRCELLVSYSTSSRVTYDLTLVADSMKAALSLARVLTMHGHRTQAVRRLQELEQLQATIAAGV